MAPIAPLSRNTKKSRFSEENWEASEVPLSGREDGAREENFPVFPANFGVSRRVCHAHAQS